MVDINRFFSAREQVLSQSYEERGIGTLAEKTLHRILKLYVEPDVDKHEVRCHGIIADVYNSEGVFEIQTRSFERLVPKLERLLKEEKVTVVCPIIEEKVLRWIDRSSGEISEPRKSPKCESALDAFRQLYRIRNYLANPNLRIWLVYLKAEEYRYLNSKGNGKRHSVRAERIPVQLNDIRVISSVDDYSDYFPDALREKFTAAEFAKAIKRTQRYSYPVLRFFLETGAISYVEKQGKAFVYKRNG